MTARGHVATFLAGLAILYSRRPDAFTCPQLWAEDGTLWYPQAYHVGWLTLTSAEGGYLQTLPRLVGFASLLFPLSWAPALFTGVALLARLLPVHVLASSRFAALLPDLRQRMGLALLYLAVPNAWEVHANMTQAVRHLAVAAVMIALVEGDRRWGWRVFDLAVILLTGLSAPFTVLLLPVLVLRAWGRPVDAHRVAVVVAALGTALAQLVLMRAWTHLRPPAVLGADPLAFARIVGGQIVAGGLLGQVGLEELAATRHGDAVTCLLTLALVPLAVPLLRRGPRELQLFVLFTALVFAAALLAPLPEPTGSAWRVMAMPGVGGRYWYLPVLGLLAWLAWIAGRGPRGAAAALALVASIGVVADWRCPPRTDLHFAAYARMFEAAQPGEIVEFPIHPPGWRMRLIKDYRTLVP